MNLMKLKSDAIKAAPSFAMGVGGAFGLKATIDGIRSTFRLYEDGYDRGYFSKESGVSAQQRLKVFAKYYWPVAVDTGIATGCFIGAMCGYSSQIAGAMAVASYYERDGREYRDKTRELYGEEADKQIRDGVYKDRIDRNPPPEQINEYAYRIYDPVTEQYFEATPDEINHCNDGMNDILGKENAVQYNYMLQFFRGVSHTRPIGYEIGWFLDDTYLEYHYYNESFFGRPHFKIVLKKEDTQYGIIYILRTSIEPMLNLELDADVVRDSQDKHGL